MKRIAIVFLFLILPLVFVFPQSGNTDNLLFKVIVYGPSDEIFIWWGHAALVVEDIRWNYQRVFDWGVFYYPSPDFLRDFMGGNVRYRCESGYLNTDFFIDEDRDIAVYTLNLDHRAKEAILAYAENNILPENCYYDYHELKDNCSTRIRDIIDLGTGGQFRAAFDCVPGRFSIRGHIRRYTWFRPVPDWFLSFLMGRDLDREITPWEEMFLPVEIARNITDFSYIDETGMKRPLVSSVEIINSSRNRQPILNAPLDTWPFALAFGLIAAVFLFIIRLNGEKFLRAGAAASSGVAATGAAAEGAAVKYTASVCRIALGICSSLLGLLLGAAGCVLVFGLFFLNNDYIQQNLNVFFINPLLFTIAPLGIMAAINRPRKFPAAKILSWIWTLVFAIGFGAMLLWIFPSMRQQNQDVLAVVLPAVFALSILPEKIRSLLPGRMSGNKVRC